MREGVCYTHPGGRQRYALNSQNRFSNCRALLKLLKEEESEEDTDMQEEKKPLTMSENTKDDRTKNTRDMSHVETQKSAFQAGAQSPHRH